MLQNPLPLTSDVSEKELMTYIKHNNTPAIELKNYPCNTQAVERSVNLLSGTAGQFADRNSGIGLFLSVHESVRIKPCQTVKQKLNIAFK